MPSTNVPLDPKAARQLLPLAVLSMAVALTVVVAPALAAPALTVRLHAHVMLDHASVKLGDVAELTGGDAASVRRLAALDIGPAPPVGTTFTLSRPVLEAWVHRSRQDPSPTLIWQGTEAALIQRQSQWVEADVLESAARQALPPRAADAATPPLVQALPRLRVPTGRLSVRARPPLASEPVGSRITVWIDLAVDDRTVLSHPAVFALGEAQASFDIRQGDAVRLLGRIGAVKVEMPAQALQNGRAGQSIRVRSASAEAPVLATVLRTGEVEMLP